MKKILIIEDNKDVRENIVEILQLADYNVLSAENGKIGISLLSTFQPDIILCDIMMPDLDGYGVLKIINNNPRYAQIPFIFLTAKAEKTDIRKGMSLGAVDYITKPFDDVDLLSSIEMRLKKSQSMLGNHQNQFVNFDTLPNNYIFDTLLPLTQGRDEIQVKKKDIIYQEGKLPRNIFLVIKGKIRITKVNETGKEITLRIVGPGEYFGYMDAMSAREYTKNAVALESGTLYSLPISEFTKLVLSDQQFCLSLIKSQIAYSQVMENMVSHYAYSSVRKKVANALLFYYQANEAKSEFHILREELASFAGAAKETVIRTLSDFKDEGIIEVIDQSIHLINIHKLAHMPQ